jgi:hypothetical protein
MVDVKDIIVDVKDIIVDVDVTILDVLVICVDISAFFTDFEVNSTDRILSFVGHSPSPWGSLRHRRASLTTWCEGSTVTRHC